MRALRMVALAGAAAVALAGILAGTAAADPASTPADNSIVAVGSDTIQALANTFSTHYNATTPANNFYSWDAFPGSTTIVPKAGCTAINRPNGSSAGLNALNANTTIVSGGKTYYCLDVARSSRAWNSATDGADVFVTIARDAITWSASGSSANAVATLTPAQLTSIYSANTGSCLKWSDVGGTSTNVIVPVLPQAGSGTRSQFLKNLGITTVGTCVTNASGSTAIEENEGTNCAFWTGTCPPNTTANPDVIFPYSIGAYICQADLGHCPANSPGNLVLKQVNGLLPTSGTGTSTVINSGFYSSYFRNLYLATRYTGVTATPIPDGTGTGSINLRPFLGDGDNTGWVCGATAQADVAAQGFLPPAGGLCGFPVHK